MNKKQVKTLIVASILCGVCSATALADFGYADSTSFNLDLRTAAPGGSYSYADSASFNLDLRTTAPGGSYSWSDSGTFTLNLRGVSRGCSDSDTFTLETRNVLTVDTPGYELWGNVTDYQVIRVINNGSIEVPKAVWNSSTQEWEKGYLMLEADTIVVEQGCSISADGGGYSSDPRDANDGGPGHGDPFIWDIAWAEYGGGEGAGHGGQGGSHSHTTYGGNGGDIYGDDYIDPCADGDSSNWDWANMFGSAGGDYYNFRVSPEVANPGGTGGGYIRLKATTSITIEGSVSADGMPGGVVGVFGYPPGAGSGGGSGGQIVLDAPAITLSGTLSATGGNGSDPSEPVSSGGGGGGRIKVLGAMNPVCVPLSAVAGGQGGMYGAGDGDPGTVRLPSVTTGAPTISGLANDTGRDSNDLVTKDAIIEGTAVPDSTVKLYVGGSVVGSGPSDSYTGAFAIPLSGVSDGTIEVAATAQESCANESDMSDSFTFVFDTQPPIASPPDMVEQGPSAGGLINDDVVSDPSPTFSGTVDADCDWVLYVDGSEEHSAVTSDGSWTWTINPVVEGNHQITVKAVDAAGNESQVSPALSILIDLTPPQIGNVQVTPSGDHQAGQVFTIEATVTDALSGANTGWDVDCDLELPDETVVDQVTLTHQNAGVFSGNWDSAGVLSGTYVLDFTAWDVAGNEVTVDNGTNITILAPIAGDTDSDGDVDIVDLGALAGNYGTTTGATWEQGDFDNDGDVDIVDLGALAGNYGYGTSSVNIDFAADWATLKPASVQDTDAEQSSDENNSPVPEGNCSPLAGLFIVTLMLAFSLLGMSRTNQR